VGTALRSSSSLSHVQNLQELSLSLADLLSSLLCKVSSCSEEVRADFSRIIRAQETLDSLLEKVLSTEDLQLDDPKGYWSKICHNLRAPMNVIKNYSEIILENLEDEEDGALKNLIPNFKDLMSLAHKTLPEIDRIGREFYDDELENHSNAVEEEWHFSEGGTVLIIDDNLDNCDVLARRLEKWGLTTLVTNDGYEGLKAARNNDIDLILLDIMMPVLDGYQVLDRLKANDDLRDIPVLMISSVGDLSSIVRCIEAGADDYLPTPFNPVLLRARITACLEKKKHHDREIESMRNLETAQKQLSAAIESVDEGFAIFDASDRLVKFNEPFKKFYKEIFDFYPDALDYDSFLKKGLASHVFMPDRRQQETAEDWLERHRAWHADPQGVQFERLRSALWIEIKEYKTPDGGTVAIHKDVTERKKKEEKLKYLALHDTLTGLANRTLFEQVLNIFVTHYHECGEGFSLIYLDLDDFKGVNDTFGHECGDTVLKFVAEALQKTLRDEDVVVRLGGDEFAALVKGKNDRDTLYTITNRALDAINQEFSCENGTPKFGASIGVAFFPQDAASGEDLVKVADEAMYAAKKAGKGGGSGTNTFF